METGNKTSNVENNNRSTVLEQSLSNLRTCAEKMIRCFESPLESYDDNKKALTCL